MLAFSPDFDLNCVALVVYGVLLVTCSLYRGGAERPSDASYAGRVQPHRGLRSAARWAHHQPVLLGLAHGREEKPAVSGSQQHRPLHCPLTHQSWLHDLQRWLSGPLLVPPHHHRLRHVSTLPPPFPSRLLSLRDKQILNGFCRLRNLSELVTFFWSVVSFIFTSFETVPWNFCTDPQKRCHCTIWKSKEWFIKKRRCFPKWLLFLIKTLMS